MRKFTIHPHHHDAKLGAGFKATHSERYLLPRLGLVTAPVQGYLRESSTPRVTDVSYKMTEHTLGGKIKWKYVAVLADGYVHCVTDDFAIGQDAVDGHTGLGRPGKCRHERKSGGSLCPSSQHLTIRANLKEETIKGRFLFSLNSTTKILLLCY